MATPLYGQVVVTGSAMPLSAVTLAPAAFSVKAPSTNANPVYLGDVNVTVSTGYALNPGDSLDYENSDESGKPRYSLSVSDFYVAGTNGDVVTWLASP